MLKFLTKIRKSLAPLRTEELDTAISNSGTNYPRPKEVEEVRRAIRSKRNAIVYGPARQGKTTIVLEAIEGERALYIECRPGFKRTHIYRIILSHIGYSVLISRKRKIKSGVKISIPGKIFSGDGGQESEREMQDISVDLKNPSEVAHLISKMPDTPLIVLNSFHMLNDSTQKNILLDLAFFSERSNLRFILIGAWQDGDHLEVIEPAISGKIDPIYIPYWSDGDLLQFFRWRRDGPLKCEVDEDKVEELISLSGGDISLFSYLLDVLSSDSFENFRDEAVRVTVLRSRRVLETRLTQFIAQRAWVITYAAGTVDVVYQRNPKFIPIESRQETKYATATINKRTKRPFFDGRRVRLDDEGNPEYVEKFNASIVDKNIYIAKFFFLKLYECVVNREEYVDIVELSKSIRDDLMHDGVKVNLDKIRDRIINLAELQIKELIIPPLIFIDPISLRVSVDDRRLLLTMMSMDADDFSDWIGSCIPEKALRARRMSRVSDEISFDERGIISRNLIRDFKKGEKPSPNVTQSTAMSPESSDDDEYDDHDYDED